eukprot:scaffold16996_cov50-Attheya_sp.AAC.3
MMLRTFNLVPTMTLFLYMATSMPQPALAKQELGSFQEVEEEVVHEFLFSVDLLIVGPEDALTESQKDLMGKNIMQDYNHISDDMQIGRSSLSRKLNSAGNS